MNILAIDTTTEQIIVSIYKDGYIDYFVGETNAKRHNAKLLEVVDDLLDKNDMTINDVDYFGVVIGPGSFTGIRIGVATVNAFSLVMGKPIICITTLEENDDGEIKTVVMDCKHGNYYAADFGTEIKYYNTNQKELNEKKNRVEIFIKSDPDLIIKKCLEKIKNLDFKQQAQPFYLKKSSAEYLHFV